MFRSLRSKLIAAFAFIIFLSLFLAGSAFVLLIRDYQTQLALNQLADLALPVSFQVSVLERAGADTTQIRRFLEEQASEVSVRMLLVDPQGKVLEDTGDTLQGRDLHIKGGRELIRSGTTYWGTIRQPDGQVLYFVAPGARVPRPTFERFVVRPPGYGVVLAVPQANVSAGLWRLAPMLSAAAAVSLLVSIGVAVLLARSIAGPIAQVTRASDQMARGNYDQYIEARGDDEVGRLARTFNRMARQVALSHGTLRDFLANVSHELRTPLTSIQGFSQAMSDGTISSPEDYAEAGRIITEEADRMRRLVDDLLELSRLESGQAQLERRALNLADLIRASLRRVERWAEERSVELRLEAAELPLVEGDDHRLEQVFGNLLDNALRHTPTGGSVTVRGVVEEAEPGPAGERLSGSEVWVRVDVQNTGSYIPPEDLHRVFERFYQVDKARAKEGSGLGLSIVREIVQAHGGSVEAASSVEDGTTFAVRLPALPAAGIRRHASPSMAAVPPSR